MNRLGGFYLIVLAAVLAPMCALAWHDGITHRQLSEFAAEKFFGTAFIDQEVNGRRVRTWISDGSVLEDASTMSQFVNGTARSLNHFHAPDRPLVTAGLNDIKSGISSLRWAQNGPYQVSKGWEDWSWQAVRDHYYKSLTLGIATDREDRTSKTYLGLGYQIHLVQDMSQPNHVRNDTHIWDGAGWRNGLETWAKNNRGVVNNILNSSVIPTVTVDLKVPFGNEDTSLTPVARLSDTRSYFASPTPSASFSQGLAEYTSANFFSENTRFAYDGRSPGDAHYFPYPRKSETNMQNYIDNVLDTAPVTDSDGAVYDSFKITKTNTTGEPLDCLARPGVNTKKYYQEFGEGAPFYRSFALDETCYREYANKLLPRAAAYSIAMIDYFFRGTIEITLPTKGVYAIAAPSSPGYTEIRVKARNSTATNEEMTDGTLQLVVKYKMALSDPFQNAQVDAGPEQYIVASEKNNVRTLSRTGTTELVFDLTSNPLPFWAVDVSTQLVYHGQLGNEANSVAVGTQDISEPTPIDVVNFMDLVCINNTVMTAGSPEAITVVDFNHNGLPDYDVYPHGLTNVYLAFNGANASVANHSATIANIPPGNYGRVFVLGEYLSLPVSVDVTLQIPNAQDTFPHSAFTTFVEPIEALDNQHFYPIMFDVRGITSWWYSYYTNAPYPGNSTCDFTTASPNITGPVSATIP